MGDPIYDTSNKESAYFEALGQPSIVKANSKNRDHFHPCMYNNDANFGQHEEDIFTDLFQASRADLLQHSHGNFQPCSIEYNADFSIIWSSSMMVNIQKFSRHPYVQILVNLHV